MCRSYMLPIRRFGAHDEALRTQTGFSYRNFLMSPGSPTSIVQ
jgi:hypothetical protein